MYYQEIRSSQDISDFISETNGFHDGYLVSVHYYHTGFEWGNPLYIDEQKAILKLQIIVTSMHSTRIELVFEAVHAWQVKENQNEMLDTSVSFTGDGLIHWHCDDDDVIAKTMKWRIIPNYN